MLYVYEKQSDKRLKAEVISSLRDWEEAYYQERGIQ